MMTHYFTKRVLSLLMVCAMLFSLLAVSASAEETAPAELKLVSKAEGTLKKGDTFTVEVQFPSTQEFSNIELFFDFDPAVFQLKAVNTSYKIEYGGTQLSVNYIAGNPQITCNLKTVTDSDTGKTYEGMFTCASGTNVATQEKGILFTMEFQVLSCCGDPSGITLVSQNFKKLKADNSGAFEPITITITPASITVPHTLTPVSAKLATCTEDGSSAYWTCSGCGKWFSDAEGQSVIENHDSVVIPAGHTPEEVWSYDTNGHWHQCANCDVKVDYAAHNGGTATCTQQATCTVCQQPYGSTAAHAYETTHSDTQHWQACKNCGAETTRQDHTYGAWETVTDSTCYAEGVKKHTCTFSGCGQEETGTIDKKDHSWSAWTEEDGKMIRLCQNTGCIEKETMSTATVIFTKKTDGTYNGSAYPLSDFVNAATVNGSSENITYWMNGQQVDLGTTTVTDANTYTVQAVYRDDTAKKYGTAEVRFEINPKTVDVSGWTWDYSAPFTYDREKKTVKLRVSDLAGVTVTYTDNEKADAGSYTAKATVTAANSNYQVTGTVSDLPWMINPAEVAAPTAVTGLKYTGQSQTGVAAASAHYTVTGGTGTDFGTYTATASLTDKANYCWSDKTTEDKTISWSIAKADGLTLTGSKSLLYSNAALQTLTAAEMTDAAEVSLVSINARDEKNILNEYHKESAAVTYALRTSLGKSDAGTTADLIIEFDSKNYERSTYTLTITLTDKTDVSDKITFENGQATYNGQKQTHETAKFDGAASDKITYTYSADPIHVGTYSVTATYEDAANYGTKTASFQILPASLRVTGGTVAAKDYDGTAAATVTGVTFSGQVNGETVTDYTVSGAAFADANAGTGKTVTFSVALGESVQDYTLSDPAGQASGTITPREITVTAADIEGSFTYTGSSQTPAVTVTATGTLGDYVLVKDTDYTVNYSNNTNAGTASVRIAPKTGSNYTFTPVVKTFAIGKATPIAAAENISLYYTGRELADSVIKGTATFQGQNVPGSWTWVDQPAGVTVGTYENARVRFNPGDAANLNAVEQNITVTIQKTNPTGEPAYKTISESGKTLADAGLGLGTLPEGGTIVWIDGDGKVLPDDTKVEVNKAYTWRYTPADTVNYNERTGTVTLYAHHYIPITPTKPGSSTAEPVKPVVFTDVGKGDWYYESVQYVCEKGLMNGTGAGTFSPNADTTRGMIVTILARLEGVDTTKGSSWYEAGRKWAMENGISDGTSMTGEMTREQLATILYRYAGLKGYSVSAKGSLSSFHDAGQVSDWAVDAMKWANAESLINGKGGGLLDPQGKATRAETAAILMRFMRNIAKLEG